MNVKPRILIVEDEESIREGLLDVFLYHGYEVHLADNGTIALEKALKEKYDLILLDVMIPHIDGFEVCNRIREHSREQPIVMLTAKTAEEDIVHGLKLGADDYVAKPFSVRELVLRVEAVLRRSKSFQRKADVLEIGGILSIDTRTLEGVLSDVAGQVSECGGKVQFTRREVDLLAYLKVNEDRPVSREELLDHVWGYKRAELIETRTVDIHIAKLRRKIEMDAKEPRLLLTVRGEGYRLGSGL